jgi:hypothetical protein
MSESLLAAADRILVTISKDRESLVTKLQRANPPVEFNVQHTCSNADLMLRALSEFDRGESAQFLPVVIASGVRQQLAAIEPALNAIVASEADVTFEQAMAVLDQLDRLYAYCLQYGLISFGFSSKIATRVVEDISADRSVVKKATSSALASVRAHEKRISGIVSEVERNATSRVDEVLQGLAASGQAAKDNLAAIEFFHRQGQSLLSQIDTAQRSASIRSGEIESATQQAEEHTQAMQTARLQIDAIGKDARAVFQNFNSELTSQTAVATASAKAIAELQAKVSLTEADITKFFGEIEKYRGSYAEAKKEADGHYNKLKADSDLVFEDCKTKTVSAVEKNLALQEEIQEHLRKAVGVSLFSAFDKRRRGLSIASWVWAALLIMSVGGTIWYGLWFVEHLKDMADLSQKPALIFARLAIFAPLAFLIAFNARRFSTERRAEEEYAFKSAISVSLDSFRELIDRMKQKGQDTALVEKLVLEIFDNPTKRLYAVKAAGKSEREDSGASVAELIEKALDKIPNAKA